MKALLFVDDEPKVLQGLQRQLHGMRDEWKMNFVDSGAKALEFMAANPVDVIVTDMKMPFMDGAQLLAEVIKRHPNAVRMVLSGHSDRESVLRLVGPAHQYLSKPCNPEQLRSAINRAFSLRSLLANEQLKQLASRTCSLPTIPTLHNQLTEELLKEEPSMQRVADIVSRDMAMTSKILQLVNSAFFGLPQPITNAHEAVVYLGQATVRALVLSLQIFAQFQQKTVEGFSIDVLAEHSWMVGVLARRIAVAERCEAKLDDLCFLAGLLHDVGQLILASGLPVKYAGVLATARSSGKSIWEVEQAEFGASHAEVGGYLLGLWGLPNPVTEAVALHHRPGDATACAFSPVIAVHVANAFTHDQTGTHPEWPGNQINLACLTRLGLAERVETWRSVCLDINK
jgi:HD-like signal output (HDOD) protein/CheY-like chemotaxis protein